MCDNDINIRGAEYYNENNYKRNKLIYLQKDKQEHRGIK